MSLISMKPALLAMPNLWRKINSIFSLNVTAQVRENISDKVTEINTRQIYAQIYSNEIHD